MRASPSCRCRHRCAPSCRPAPASLSWRVKALTAPSSYRPAPASPRHPPAHPPPPSSLQASPRLSLPSERVKALTARIQDAGTEVVQAKAGTGSATLSMAHAAARFSESCLRALAGQPGVLEYSEEGGAGKQPFSSGEREDGITMIFLWF